MDIKIEFIAANVFASMSEREKMNFLLKSVKNKKIIVLERKLSSGEERTLITETMKHVDNKFSGIEISSLGTSPEDVKSRIIEMLGGSTGGMTVIGPSNLVKKVKRDSNTISLLAGMKRR